METHKQNKKTPTFSYVLEVCFHLAKLQTLYYFTLLAKTVAISDKGDMGNRPGRHLLYLLKKKIQKMYLLLKIFCI